MLHGLYLRHTHTHARYAFLSIVFSTKYHLSCTDLGMLLCSTDGQHSTVQHVASKTNLLQLHFLIQFDEACGTNTASILVTANTPRCSRFQGTDWFKL